MPARTEGRRGAGLAWLLAAWAVMAASGRAEDAAPETPPAVESPSVATPDNPAVESRSDATPAHSADHAPAGAAPAHSAVEAPGGVTSEGPGEASDPRAPSDPPREDAADEALATPIAWDMAETRYRAVVLAQSGRGYQSQDGPPGGPGSEDLKLFQGMAQLSLRQNEDVTYTATVPIDVVTSASADALDAMTSASRVNEASGLELLAAWQATPVDATTFRAGFRVEEPFRSWGVGAGYARSLAEDNAVVSVSGNYVYDFFDWLDPEGYDHGITRRQLLNANLTVSQLLSPTTIVWLTYGLTRQWGTLEQTWNGVPAVIDCPVGMTGDAPCFRQVPAAEQFPRTRHRHALSARLAQHLPPTGSTLRLFYRYYRDDWGLDAHTAQAELYQPMSRYLRLGLSYRYYWQSGVDFWTRSIPGDDVTDPAPRTADSDLAPLHAHEYGLKLLVYLHPPGSRRGAESIELGYLRYARAAEDERRLGIEPGATDMTIDLWSLAYARVF